MYIYLTQNLINGKIYIGKSKLDSTSEKAKKYIYIDHNDKETREIANKYKKEFESQNIIIK